MIGGDDSPQTIGAIPSAIAWLFKLINEKKERTSTRFSVRVSAVEVHGKQEHLRDLLIEQANGKLDCIGYDNKHTKGSECFLFLPFCQGLYLNILKLP